MTLRSDADLSSHPSLGRQPSVLRSTDVVVLHSVAQYLTPQELDATLTLFRRILAPDGLFLLGDVIPPKVSAVTDAGALLGFAAANGFFWAAVGGLIRTGLSDYWTLRGALGLANPFVGFDRGDAVHRRTWQRRERLVRVGERERYGSVGDVSEVVPPASWVRLAGLAACPARIPCRGSR